MKTILPQLRKDISLREFGYSILSDERKRRKALREASKVYTTKTILQRLNLIRNKYKSHTKNKKIFSEDVNYIKKLYKKEKIQMKHINNILDDNRPLKKILAIKNIKFRGGDDIDTAKEKDVSIIDVVSINKINYLFKKINDIDAEEIFVLDKNYIDGVTLQMVQDKIEQYRDNIYGLFTDNKLLGYACIKPSSVTTSTIHIDYFNAVKGNGTIFLNSLQAYLVATYHPEKISITICTCDKNFLRMLNFWAHNSFMATDHGDHDDYEYITFTLSIIY
jgi:hypothetical protein